MSTQYELKDFLGHVSELSTISPVAVELINKINLPNTTRGYIADLIEKDEILYANIFKFVNSAAFPSVRKPQNITQAVDLMGTNEVRNLVFSIAARKAFVDLDLWFRSVFTAFAAQKFARIKEYNQEDVSNTYILGLMQSLGEQIFTIFYQQQNEPVTKAKSFAHKLELQREIFGVDCVTLSCEIIKEFGLPDAILELAETQKIEIRDPNFKEQNAFIYLAASLAELAGGDVHEDTIDARLDPYLMQNFDLEDTLKITVDMFKDLQSETKSFVNM